MERLTNNCLFYLDYNASSPLANSVKNWISSGDLFLGNAQATHSLGKKSAKLISQTRNFLFEFFGLSDQEYQIVFHSGATEGINLFFKSIADERHFLCSAIDHSASHELLKYFKNSSELSVDQSGNLLLDIDHLKNQKLMMNATYVHGELGNILNSEALLDLKNKFDLLIHLDCAQIVGKIKGWNTLPKGFDAYTFSGHKFGAFKGVGFSFIKKNVLLNVWLHGGNQQLQRSGTLNEIGIYSLKLALEEFMQTFNATKVGEVYEYASRRIKDILGDHVQFISGSHEHLNTFFFLLKNIKADQMLTIMDLAGIYLGTGPACSSGIVKESRVLSALKIPLGQHKATIRFSYNPITSKEEMQIVLDKFAEVFNRLT